MRESPAWGIFGGSFDPPHLGHLMAAAAALAQGGLERLWVVPCFSHPFGKQLASFADRVAMARLAFRHLAAVEVDDLEGSLPQPSYTLATVQALAARHPGVRWRLVIGSDTLADLGSWHRWDEVSRLAEPLVIGRAGRGAAPGVPVVPDVNSTELRRALAAGEPAAGRLDAEVERFIRERGLYRG